MFAACGDDSSSASADPSTEEYSSSSEKDDKSSSSESPKSSSSETIKASVAVQKSKVSKAETIQKKIYGCADGDSTRTFKFFDGSYVYETLVNDQVMNWNAGRYDIQRSTLLMLPLYYGGGGGFSYDVLLFRGHRQ